MTPELEAKIRKLQGPVLVLGASGFVGANLLRMLLSVREDVYGTLFHYPAWRLSGLPEGNVIQADLLVEANIDAILDKVQPRTVFNCIAYGAYSFEVEGGLIYETNFNLTVRLLQRLQKLPLACYVHSGSSSEYGDRAAGPSEDDLPQPNSDYAVSKVACANLLQFYGKKKKLSCANLPTYVTCVFTPTTATLNANGSTTASLYLDTDSVIGYARNDPGPLRRTGYPINLALLLCPFGLLAGIAAFPRRRAGRHPRLRLMVLLLAAMPTLMSFTGCSTEIIPFDLPASAAPGTYTLSVTASGSATGITHTVELTLTVTP